MNTHKFSDQDLDKLFTQALQPLADAQPQPHAWSRLATHIIDSPPRWRWLRSWLSSSNSPFQPFSSQPTRVDGRLVRAPYLDSFSSQVFNLRLAS